MQSSKRNVNRYPEFWLAVTADANARKGNQKNQNYRTETTRRIISIKEIHFLFASVVKLEGPSRFVNLAALVPAEIRGQPPEKSKRNTDEMATCPSLMRHMGPHELGV